MLGAPCSPCCGLPDCDDQQRQSLFDYVCSRSCQVTLAAGLPYQDAAAFTANGHGIVSLAGLTDSPTSAQWLSENTYFRCFRQHSTASGVHTLSLDLSASQMFFVNGVMAGVVVFRKDTNDYSISVRVNVGWPDANRFAFSGTNCLGSVSASVSLYHDVTFGFIRRSPPQGITAIERLFPYSVNGQTPVGQLAYANAPYFQRQGFPASPGIVSDQGELQSFNAAWDVDVKPADIPWSRFTHSSYSWAPSLNSDSTNTQMSFSYDAVPRTPSAYEVGRWEPYSSTQARPEWIKNISFQSPMILLNGFPRFAIQYSQAEKFYSFAQMSPSSSTLQNSQIVLA